MEHLLRACFASDSEVAEHNNHKTESSASMITTAKDCTPMEKDRSFRLFGQSIKLEKEHLNVHDGVSSVKNGTFFFELIKIEEKEENDDTRLLFNGDCGRKMIDFMGLCSRKEKTINDGLIMSLKAVQECGKYDQETNSLIVNNKKRNWISTLDDLNHIPCWPKLHKKRRMVRGPNRHGLMSLKAVQECPKYDQETNSLIIVSSKKRNWISTLDDLCNDDHIPCWPTLHKKRRMVRGPNATTSTSSVVRLPLVNANENLVVNTAVLPNPLQLVLFNQDPWKIKKILKKSDVNGSSRLLIGTDMVSRHILPHVRRNNANFLHARGTEVVVWDVDTGSQHTLTFKRWKSNSFVFVGGWTSDFVKRRNLKESDEIGLKWDDANSRLEFTLLHRNH